MPRSSRISPSIMSRVFREIAVDLDRAVWRADLLEIEPILSADLFGLAAPPQEQDIRSDVRSGVGLEGAIAATWKPDRAQELCTPGDFPPGGIGLFVERVEGGDEHDKPARANLVEGLDEEIVVDRQMPVAGVLDPVIAEGNVRDGKIEIALGPAALLEPFDPDDRRRDKAPWRSGLKSYRARRRSRRCEA